MVHGRDREEVTQKVREIVETCGLQDFDHTILFSTRRFKQRGAQYSQIRTSRPTAIKLAVKLKLVKPDD
jgi:hypothetical protein